jgi:hypothetical protein
MEETAFSCFIVQANRLYITSTLVDGSQGFVHVPVEVAKSWGKNFPAQLIIS